MSDDEHGTVHVYFDDRRPSTTPYDVRDATPPVELTEGTTAGRARAVVVLANVLTSLRRDGINPRAILAAVPGLAQAIVTELDATPSAESVLFGRIDELRPRLTPLVAPTDIAEPRRQTCPDGGACHHGCSGEECWRVRWAGPLSGVFPDDRWPEDVQP